MCIYIYIHISEIYIYIYIYIEREKDSILGVLQRGNIFDFSRHSIVADTILYTKKTILGANIGKFRIVVTQNRCV